MIADILWHARQGMTAHYSVVFLNVVCLQCVVSDGSIKLEADVQAGQAEHLFRKSPQSAKAGFC
jgi:hypothetical protein